MAIYTVHEPLPRKREVSADPGRFVFVRDGFYFWAFVLGPVWMLWRRLWLVALMYFSISVALQLGLWALDVSSFVKSALGFLLALLIGFEAGTLRRWTLTRHGWKNVGVVVGGDIEAAERNFFASWSPHGQRAPMSPAPAQSPGGVPRSGDGQIIGLFPQPGAPR